MERGEITGVDFVLEVVIVQLQFSGLSVELRKPGPCFREKVRRRHGGRGLMREEVRGDGRAGGGRGRGGGGGGEGVGGAEYSPMEQLPPDREWL